MKDEVDFWLHGGAHSSDDEEGDRDDNVAAVMMTTISSNYLFGLISTHMFSCVYICTCISHVITLSLQLFYIYFCYDICLLY